MDESTTALTKHLPHLTRTSAVSRACISVIRGGHAAHWVRSHRHRGHDELCARRMLCIEVRSVAAKGVASVATDHAIRVGTNRRRCAHRARSDMSNALLPCVAARKPIGDLCKERFRVADSFDQRRSAASTAFLLREKRTTDLETKPRKSFAPGSAATATVRPGRTGVGAASTNVGATTAATS
jgi:hypothetical protein